MNRPHPPLIRIAAACLGLLPALALAHPGHGEQMSFVAGALHPVSGLDHLAGFVIVGVLLARLRARILRPMMAALLGLLVAAWTTDSDGWRYAAGFVLTGATLAAITAIAARLTKKPATAAAPRSRT